jgi:biotin operon repressor
MRIERQVEQLTKFHRLVLNRRTGTPDRLCRILGMSKSKLYEVIDDLRAKGAQIVYSRKRETFYYEHPFLIDLRCDIRPLKPDEMDETVGGTGALGRLIRLGFDIKHLDYATII